MKRGGPLKRYTRMRRVSEEYVDALRSAPKLDWSAMGLKRKKPLRSRSTTSKHANRERDWVYIAFVRSRPCIARLLVTTGVECDGPIQADHVGGRYGEGSDRRCAPMCRKHHEDRTGRVGGKGLFAGWSLERRRDWGRRAIADTLAAYEGRT